MGKTVVITRPDFDLATYYWKRLSSEVITYAKESGFEVIDLPKEKATRQNLERAVQRSPNLYILNGHGTTETVMGQKNEVILNSENVSRFSGSIIYTIACEAIVGIGKRSISDGVRCFIGYKFQFAVYSDKNHSANPENDEYARHFFGATNMIPKTLFKGNSCNEAVERAREAFQKSIIELKTRTVKESLPDNVWTLKYLLWDAASLHLEGDGDSRAF